MKRQRHLTKLAATALLTVMLPATAAAASSSRVAVPCGFHEEGNLAYYNNCTGKNHKVAIDWAWWPIDSQRCAAPGDHSYGQAGEIDGISSIGGSC